MILPPIAILKFQKKIGALFLCLSFLWINPAFGSNRSFTQTPGAVLASKLPEDFKATLIDIKIVTYDAFEGSKVNTPIEEDVFELGNKLHIKSKQKTISKRLLVSKGQQVDKEDLMESEKKLRSEEFLADAIIEVLVSDKNEASIVVHTFDQFSTTPGIGLQKPAQEWEYWFGLLESNLMGGGQKIGAFYTHTIDRNTVSAIYENKAFIKNNFKLSGRGGLSTDGYEYEYYLGLPLLSKKQKWAYNISGLGLKSNRYYYADADDPGEAERKMQAKEAIKVFWMEDSLPSTLPVFLYRDIVDLGMSLSVTRSFGSSHKFNVSGKFSWDENYQQAENGNYLAYYNLYQNSPYVSGDFKNKYALDFRRDFLLGASFSYYQSKYKTVKNFRNVKWTEDIDVGFRFTQDIYKNLKFAGAHNSDWKLKHSLVYINAWNNMHFVNTAASLGYFWDGAETLEDGYLSHVFEYQFKPTPRLSSYFYSSWYHYFEKELSSQLYLGGEQGLSGYPNRFFSGQARYFMQLEQRYFPNLEFGTAVPALAVFLNGGDVFPTRKDFEWDELHYSAGIGLRVGATRSVQKVVNHINISFPIDGKYRDILPGWRFTVLAKTSL